jgi:hypothetical protein
MGVPTVWILGAGFSKALGAPILNEVLSSASVGTVTALYWSNPWIGDPSTDVGLSQDAAVAEAQMFSRRAAKTAQALYSKCGPDGKAGDRRWEDAEAFLDYLDVAHHDPKSPACTVLDDAITREEIARSNPCCEWPRLEVPRDRPRRETPRARRRAHSR